MSGKQHRVKKGEKIRLGKTIPKKVCKNCGVEKSCNYFPKRGGQYAKLLASDPKRYDTQCKQCKKPRYPNQKREDVAEVKARHITKGRATRRKNEKKKGKKNPFNQSKYRLRIREETRVKSMLYLAEKGCEECGERDPRVLEYDHKNPEEKKQSIARLILNSFGWDSPTMRREVAKCRILCANCHQKHTIRQHGYYAADEIQRTLGKLAARYKFEL